MRLTHLLAATAAIALVAVPAVAETVKVGFITTTSGPFASLGLTQDNAVKLFVAKNGDSSGGAAFFNDLSLALMGRYRGGAAKISVVASSLFGSISGVVVSNILATGVVTIPLMKKSALRGKRLVEARARSCFEPMISMVFRGFQVAENLSRLPEIGRAHV